MKQLKCETCGSPLDLVNDGLHARCPVCGNIYSYEAPKNDYLVDQMNEANELRNKNDFYDAINKYRNVISHNMDDAQAHWGLLLSTYGIGYEIDYDGSYIPTFHRYKSDKITENKSYKNALKFATDEQRTYYEEQGAVLQKIQDKITKIISLDENKYDVFISYKDSEIQENGNRVKTIDRDIAFNIYDALREKGISTFFSEVSLLDCVAAEYEPIIYNALRTCKVFILVANSKDHIYSTWVKNEWSRMLEMVKEDTLNGIKPTQYFAVLGNDVNISDLPQNTFTRKQNLMLNKYMGDSYKQDVARSVCKMLGIEDKKQSDVDYEQKLSKMSEQLENTLLSKINKNTSSSMNEANACLIRGNQCLKAGDRETAGEYFNKGIDKDPTFGDIWWAKFLFIRECDEKYIIPFKQNVKKVVDYEPFVKANNDDLKNFFKIPEFSNAKQYANESLKKRIDTFYDNNVKKCEVANLDLLTSVYSLCIRNLEKATMPYDEIAKLNGYVLDYIKTLTKDEQKATALTKLNNALLTCLLKDKEVDKLDLAKVDKTFKLITANSNVNSAEYLQLLNSYAEFVLQKSLDLLKINEYDKSYNCFIIINNYCDKKNSTYVENVNKYVEALNALIKPLHTKDDDTLLDLYKPLVQITASGATYLNFVKFRFNHLLKALQPILADGKVVNYKLQKQLDKCNFMLKLLQSDCCKIALGLMGADIAKTAKQDVNDMINNTNQNKRQLIKKLYDYLVNATKNTATKAKDEDIAYVKNLVDVYKNEANSFDFIRGLVDLHLLTLCFENKVSDGEKYLHTIASSDELSYEFYGTTTYKKIYDTYPLVDSIKDEYKAIEDEISARYIKKEKAEEKAYKRKIKLKSYPWEALGMSLLMLLTFGLTIYLAILLGGKEPYEASKTITTTLASGFGILLFEAIIAKIIFKKQYKSKKKAAATEDKPTSTNSKNTKSTKTAKTTSTAKTTATATPTVTEIVATEDGVVSKLTYKNGARVDQYDVVVEIENDYTDQDDIDAYNNFVALEAGTISYTIKVGDTVHYGDVVATITSK